MALGQFTTKSICPKTNEGLKSAQLQQLVLFNERFNMSSHINTATQPDNQASLHEIQEDCRAALCELLELEFNTSLAAAVSAARERIEELGASPSDSATFERETLDGLLSLAGFGAMVNSGMPRH